MSLDLITDFPDRLSPMLVKELRQGLRAKTFVAVFLTLQVAMALILLTAGASASSANAGSVISAVIFIFFSVAVLVVQPLRGIGAVASEIKGNTIDMMVLTRLSASRIVYGKWFALVSQSALLLSTIIPYLILRYFFGGMNLVGEIVALILLFLTSVALTAVTVGLSANTSFILRALLPIIALPILAYTILIAMISSRSSGLLEICSIEDNQSRIQVATYLATIAYLGWSMLSLGASLIAPAAENHSTRRRLIVLAIAAVTGAILAVTRGDAYYLPWAFVIIALPAIAIALSERNAISDTARQPFQKWGLPGKIAQCFLAPGWPSGVFFTLLLAAVFLVSRLCTGAVRTNPAADISLIGLYAAALFPALLLILFRTDESARFSNSLLIFTASGIFLLVMIAISEALPKNDILWFFIWNPLTFLPMSEFSGFSHDSLFSAAAGVAAVYSIALIALALVNLKPRQSV
jgi:ABC-type transport system involved in multi-copper enzyme maturation permease subunit